MTFVASNGYTVEEVAYGLELRNGSGSNVFEGVDVDYIDNQDEDALREYFSAEEDKRLGRWRWPENPTWVCYPTNHGGEVIVFNEAEPFYGTYQVSIGETTWPHARPAANAYFAANPERKPWLDAVPGEVWILKIDDRELPWGVGSGVDLGKFIYLGGTSSIPLNWHEITEGRRIWPAEDES